MLGIFLENFNSFVSYFRALYNVVILSVNYILNS